jgi:hypothetical protein
MGLALVVGMTGIGCGGARSTASRTPKVQTVESAAAGAAVTLGDEGAAQADAQKAWCHYLDVLYARATQGKSRWSKLEQCQRTVSSASPKMLKQTADCSLRALERFDGDPFSDAYAAEVGRCGTEAIEALTMSRVEIAPYVATICTRASTCGDVGVDECRSNLETKLGVPLGRAIGALNTRSRGELKACLKAASCQDVGAQIAGCLEPIMDRLLWTPT